MEFRKEIYTQNLNYTKSKFEVRKNYLTTEDKKHFNETETEIGEQLQSFDQSLCELKHYGILYINYRTF